MTSRQITNGIIALWLLVAARAVAQPGESSRSSLAIVNASLSLQGWYLSVPEAYRDYRGLVIEEVSATEIQPVLPYIFFDSASAVIPSRYHLFSSHGQTLAFDVKTLTGGTVDNHRYVLDIAGSRLRNSPALRVGIVGCNSELEPGETMAISEGRERAVYEYLRTVWRLSDTQVVLLPPRGFPDSRSYPRDPRGQRLNRRVEIVTFDEDGRAVDPHWRADSAWEICGPLVAERLRRMVFPSRIDLSVTDTAVGDALERFIEVRRNGVVWNRLAFVGSVDAITYDWRSVDGRMPSIGDTVFVFESVARYADGSERRSNAVAVPILHVDRRRAQEEFGTERRIVSAYVLSSWDHLTEHHERLLRQYVYPAIGPTSSVEVIGHTSALGLDDRNGRLSQQHASLFASTIRKNMRSVAAIRWIGFGEANPPFDNDLPEGMAMNFGQQIIIETRNPATRAQ